MVEGQKIVGLPATYGGLRISSAVRACPHDHLLNSTVYREYEDLNGAALYEMEVAGFGGGDLDEPLASARRTAVRLPRSHCPPMCYTTGRAMERPYGRPQDSTQWSDVRPNDRSGGRPTVAWVASASAVRLAPAGSGIVTVPPVSLRRERRRARPGRQLYGRPGGPSRRSVVARGASGRLPWDMGSGMLEPGGRLPAHPANERPGRRIAGSVGLRVAGRIRQFRPGPDLGPPRGRARHDGAERRGHRRGGGPARLHLGLAPGGAPRGRAGGRGPPAGRAARGAQAHRARTARHRRPGARGSRPAPGLRPRRAGRRRARARRGAAKRCNWSARARPRCGARCGTCTRRNCRRSA